MKQFFQLDAPALHAEHLNRTIVAEPWTYEPLLKRSRRPPALVYDLITLEHFFADDFFLYSKYVAGAPHYSPTLTAASNSSCSQLPRSFLPQTRLFAALFCFCVVLESASPWKELSEASLDNSNAGSMRFWPAANRTTTLFLRLCERESVEYKCFHLREAFKH